MTNLVNATNVTINNATTEVVSAAENLKGVIIQLAFLSGKSGEAGHIKVGGNLLLEHLAESGVSIKTEYLKCIPIPAGVNIELYATSSATTKAVIWYELMV
ncbi:MAG: hypothetical protein JKY93_03120 [Gammaproteobacteria bacterium]|nr:hypothetical protein [Gammaproteobacteria bacterium]